MDIKLSQSNTWLFQALQCVFGQGDATRALHAPRWVAMPEATAESHDSRYDWLAKPITRHPPAS